jgi:sigma-B regulation protein RsbU (phosphoserine phosphatase)
VPTPAADYADAVTASERGELPKERLRKLAVVTDAALAHLGVEQLLEELLERLRELLSVDTTAVLLLDPSRRYLVATAARGIEEEVHQGVRIPLGEGFAGRIAAAKRPVVIRQVNHGNVLNPILREKGIHSLLGVPLLVSGEVLGVLHVGTLRPRRFSDADIELLQLVADRVALAVRARMSETERAAAAALQRSLLPAIPPSIHGLEFGSRYVPGGRGEVGGDWYDVFAVPSGRLWIVIGDVLGRGLEAAATMGRLRSALRAYTMDTDDPAAVLTKLDQQAQQFEPGVMATVLCGVLGPGQEWLRLSCAGHVPPVLATPGQPAQLLDVPADLPVGVELGRARRVSSVEMAPGAVLCLYTDGLVERRTVSLDDGLERLRSVVRPEPVERVCIRVMGALIGADVPTDDVALLVIRRLTGP